jgi:stringent starvation protein B
MTQLLPPKKEVALALLERSNVDVYLDPRAKGVVVPPQFRKEPRLILKIGLNMPVPIPDLRLDDDSMSCTLSFNRSPFYCVVPWSSVFAMVGEDGRGMVWPDDVPQELAVKVVDPADQGAPAGPASASSSSTSGATASGRRGESTRRASTRDRAQAQADEAGAAERPVSSRGAGGKRKKKKEEPPRPVLRAVPSVPSGPSGPQPAGSQPASSDAAEPAVMRRSEGSASERPREIRQPPESRRPSNPDGSRVRDGVSAVPPGTRARPHPGPGAQPSPPSARPKRELPPYLRVVK